MENNMDSLVYGSSKFRREQIKVGIDELKQAMQIPINDSDGLSQLETLHYACKCMLKNNKIKHLVGATKNSSYTNEAGIHLYHRLIKNQMDIANSLFGFAIILTKDGTLIYVSDNVYDYLKLSPMEVLLSCDKLYETLHPNDEETFRNIFNGTEAQNGREYELFCSWHTSKIKRKVHPKSEIKVIKIKGRFTSDGELFTAVCTPILRNENRDSLAVYSSTSATLVCSVELKLMEICKRGETILGYRSNGDTVSLYELLNASDVELLRKRHKSLLNAKSKKGKTDIIRLLKKDGRWIDCLINMYFGESNNIICKLQFLTEPEMEQYKMYVSNVFDSQSEAGDDTASTPMNYNESDCSFASSSYPNINSLKRRLTDDFQQQSPFSIQDQQQTIKRVRTNGDSISCYSPPLPPAHLQPKQEQIYFDQYGYYNTQQQQLQHESFYYGQNPLAAYQELCQSYGEPLDTPLPQQEQQQPHQYQQQQDEFFDFFLPKTITDNKLNFDDESSNHSSVQNFDRFEIYEDLSFLPDLINSRNINSNATSQYGDINSDNELLDDIMSVIESENAQRRCIPVF